MVQYDCVIMNLLLDRYENSLLSTGENKRAVRIEVRFTKSLIPAYFDESSDEYERIHILMKTLESKNLIRIIWKNQKTDYVILKVRLVTEQLDEAYRYVGRHPKRGLEEESVALLEKYIDMTVTPDAAAGKLTAPIAVAFFEYLMCRLKKHQSVREYISIENKTETDKFLRACMFVEQNKDPCYIREFSIMHFQDSKYFEQIQDRVAKVFRCFSDEAADMYSEMDTSQILSEYGIYKTPNYVYFKGNVKIIIGEKVIDLSDLKQGIGISGEDLCSISFSDLSGIKKVITIENLTSFFRCNEKACLFIYLGGYHNGIRRMLLKKVYEAIPDALYYHFGDIDAGGFAILKDLRKKTGIKFQSYHMDLDTLKRYKDYGKTLTETDRKRLKKLKEDSEFREVVGFMLENNIKLEQECIIFD